MGKENHRDSTSGKFWIPSFVSLYGNNLIIIFNLFVARYTSPHEADVKTLCKQECVRIVHSKR